MTDIIETIKEKPEVKAEVQKALQSYTEANLATQAKIGAILTVQNKVYEEAVIIMGDTIYDLEIENDTLRGFIGAVDESLVQKQCEQKKRQDNRDEKNRRILQSINKKIASSQVLISDTKKALQNKPPQK